ncbi:MAG TPA: bifunctional 3-deoxy-7-phosphoheptulonate synthase/chorismate mutase [bacterium]|nr:bifunctional 3-deoxy-7-phosphoheptulonate synthase/chorismate mutase [bacterium]
MMRTLEELRGEMNYLNHALLALLSKRARVSTEVLAVKQRDNLPLHDPARELAMLEELAAANPGPFPDGTIKHLFSEIFRASVALMEQGQAKGLKVSRTRRAEPGVVTVGAVRIGAEPVVVAGPCAVESPEQMDMVARDLKRLGVTILRGGAFKPRSNPYAFQGLGEEGLRILRDTGKKYGMVTVTEVMDVRQIELVSAYADILQIGARNMHNYELLRELGTVKKPVILKRGFSATIEELLWAAEYIVGGGNEEVILCERGIRTFETQTRNTLDISAVPLLKQMSWLPVLVDVSHAAGRTDILAPLARAAIAAGADGVMVEVHPFPAVARSDSRQQLDIEQFAAFLRESDLLTGMRLAANDS